MSDQPALPEYLNSPKSFGSSRQGVEYGGTPAFRFRGYIVKGVSKDHIRIAFGDATRDPEGTLAKLKSGKYGAMGRPFRIYKDEGLKEAASKKLGLERGKQGSVFTLTITALDGRYQYRSSKSWQVDNAEREAKRDPDAFLAKLKSGQISGAYKLKEDFTMKDVKLHLCEIGPAGRTRMSVQVYYENQRKLGLSIRDAIRGTEFALNIRNIRTSSDGRTVVFFEEGTKYVTCPECDANFRESDLKDGKLPAHKWMDKTCPGTGETPLK